MSDNELELEEESVRPSDYVKVLLREKLTLNPEQHSNAMRFLDAEVTRAQAHSLGKPIKPESRYVDIYKDKPIKVTAKVLVPVKEHPRFNFVGKLLGPRGNSLKRLQEETMTKMAILGRGSMRDKAKFHKDTQSAEDKEEEFRNSLDPKYSHLTDDLHVEIAALAPPAEAYARVAFALAELRKYMVPDVNDEIRQEQLREIQQYGGVSRGGRGGLSGSIRGSRGGLGRGAPPLPRPPMLPPRTPLGAPVPPRPLPGKAKVMSILERARSSMEESYGGPSYEEPPYYDSPGPVGYDPSGYGGGAYNGSGFYEGGGYGSAGGNDSGGTWKNEGTSAGGKSAQGTVSGRFGSGRPAPYARPAK